MMLASTDFLPSHQSSHTDVRRLFKDQHSIAIASPAHTHTHSYLKRSRPTDDRHGSQHAARCDDRRRGSGGGAGDDLGGHHQLWAGELRHRPVPLLRPWTGLRPLRGMLQRRQEPQFRRQQQRRQAHSMQLPQERRQKHQRSQRRERRRHPFQVRRQHPLHHQHLHRLLQGELNLNDDRRRRQPAAVMIDR